MMAKAQGLVPAKGTVVVGDAILVLQASRHRSNSGGVTRLDFHMRTAGK
jgi:hypothetical protein